MQSTHSLSSLTTKHSKYCRSLAPSLSWLKWTRVGGTNEWTQCNSFYHLRSIEFHWFIIHWFDLLQQWAMCCAYETISSTLFPIRWRVLHSTVSTPMSCIHANDHFHPLRNAFVHGYSPFHLHFNRIVWQIESLRFAVTVEKRNNILIHDPWTICSRFFPQFHSTVVSRFQFRFANKCFAYAVLLSFNALYARDKWLPIY